MTSLGPNDCHPFYWLGIYSNLHKPKINAPENIWFIADWSPENNLRIPRCCFSKEYVHTCCWITKKKKNLGSKLDKLISNWCQIDNCFMGGYDSHICHQDWYLRLLLLNSHYLVLQVQFSHNLEGTWHIAHLQNWPKKWSIYYSSLSVRCCAWYLWPARPSDLTSSSLLSRVASRSGNWPIEMDLVGLNRPPARNGGYVICLVCTRGDPKKFQMSPILANHRAWKIDCGIAPSTLLLRDKILLLSHENGIVTTEFLRHITSQLSKNRWVCSN